MDGVKEREDLILKAENVIKEGKLAGLDKETKELCENALTRMIFELRAEASNIKRNLAFLEDYRSTQRRP